MSWPQVTVTVDGVAVAGGFFDALVSLGVSDRERMQSDAMDLVFNDAPPHFISPRRGALVRITIATGTGSFTGSYIVDKVEFACFPFTITVGGHSADMQSEMKTRRTRHWDNVTVRNLVEEIAGDYGLDPRIADVVSAHVYDWIAQQDETDLNFLESLARRHGALFTIKDGRLLWVARGQGTNASGQAIPPISITPRDIVEGTCRVTISDVEKVKEVKAYWQDRAGASRRSVTAPVDDEASGEHVLRAAYSSEAAAQAAADAAAHQILQGTLKTECSIVGNPALMAGQPIAYAGVRPWIDGREFVLETVQHRYSKSGGLRTAFSGKLKIET